MISLCRQFFFPVFEQKRLSLKELGVEKCGAENALNGLYKKAFFI